MGALTPIVITGANGFLGRACVAEARRRGQPVLALCRSAPDPAWSQDPGIAVLQADLSQTLPDALTALSDDAVYIHTAGHMGDDPAILARDTVEATARLPLRAGQKMVLISSLSVYDTQALKPGDTVTENTPALALPHGADIDAIGAASSPYAMAKRLQEQAIPNAADLRSCWTLRPGAIWGPTRTWHALQGFWASKLHVTIGSDGQLPLAHVDMVAKAALDAALDPSETHDTVNLFDDDCPTRARFLRAHRAQMGWPRLNITVPYGLWRALIRPLAPVAHRLPGLFQIPVLQSRMMPLRFDNTKLRTRLGGAQPDFETLLAAAAKETS